MCVCVSVRECVCVCVSARVLRLCVTRTKAIYQLTTRARVLYVQKQHVAVCCVCVCGCWVHAARRRTRCGWVGGNVVVTRAHYVVDDATRDDNVARRFQFIWYPNRTSEAFCCDHKMRRIYSLNMMTMMINMDVYLYTHAAHHKKTATVLYAFA